jgi:hypothetical protein
MKQLVCLTLALCLLPLIGSVRGEEVRSQARVNTEVDLWWQKDGQNGFDAL